MRRFLLLWALWWVCPTGMVSAADSDWLAAVFPERAYDFGNVARGSQIRHVFPVLNRTNSEIRIADWRTKCGCTDVRVGARVIPPGTQTTVEATINTTNFQGYKASGLTLVLDRPAFVEVDLNLTCFIRGDILMNPGKLDFGIVRHSAKLPTASLTLTYAGGRPDWDITGMKTQTAKVKAVAKELSRSGDGQSQWLVTATLQPSITTGYLKDEITLITNDSTSGTIPISVVAIVQGAASASPSIVNLGQVRPGALVSKSGVVHVRSSSPIKLNSLESSQPGLEADEANSSSSTDHLLNLKLKAPETAGPFYGVLKIATNIEKEPPLQVKVFATVVPDR
jgi:hypothetical protein